MTLQILIIGGGKVGTYLAQLLINDGHTVHIVEGSPSEYERILQELGEQVLVKGDGTDPEVLKLAGIQRADVVAAVTRYDDLNLVITSLARFVFQVPRTIARVNIPRNAWLFTKEMGVDNVLNQADLMAHLIAEEITLGEIKTLLKLQKGEYSLVEHKVMPGSMAENQEIRDLHLPLDCIFCAIIRDQNLIIPRGQVVLKTDDEILAVVKESEIQNLSEVFSIQMEKH